jgi:dynein heavy chain
VTNDVWVLTCDHEKATWSWSKLDLDSSRGPSPRESHTATYIGGGRVLVFGGQLYKEALQVYNDVYILNVDRGTWEVPEIDGKGPSPRSRHSAVYWAETESLFVFGGYRKTTRRLNDLYELNLETMTWSVPALEGEAPSPRYGHSAVLAGALMFVMGGIDSANNAIADVGILDLRLKTWTEVPEGVRLPRAIAMFGGVAMESAGAMKIFTFGGQTSSIMDFSNRVSYLDTKYMAWRDARIQTGVEPPPCGDCCAVYHARTKSILVFGGAGQQFLEGVYRLDIGAIVGPDYAMFSVQPPMGPLHGGMTCTIKGEHFRESLDIHVLIADGKREVVTKGEYLSETEVRFTLPDLGALGDRPHDVLVRISMEKALGYTVNYVPFSLYLDTKGDTCLAYGPGVLPQAATRLETSFVIWAKNLSGQDRTHGGDEFRVTVTEKRTPEQIEARRQAAQAAALTTESPDRKDASPVPGGGGGGGGTATTPRGGARSAATLAISASSSPVIGGRRGSFRPGVRVGGNSGSDPALLSPCASRPATSEGGASIFNGDDENASSNAQAMDPSGTPQQARAFVLPEDPPIEVEIIDNNNGTYECRYLVQTEGLYEVVILYKDIPIRGSPFQVQFKDDLVETQARPQGAEANFVPVMRQEIPGQLTELENRVKEYQSTLSLQIKDGNVHTLIKVMSCLDTVGATRGKIDLELDSIRETIAYLKVHGDPAADLHRKRLKAITETFEEVKQACPVVDKDLLAHKNRAKGDIKRRIEEFSRTIDRFHKAQPTRASYKSATTVPEAFHEVDTLHATLAAHELTAEELRHLANLFNYPTLLLPALAQMQDSRETLVALKVLWDSVELADTQIDAWKLVTWPELQPEAMEARVKEIFKELRLLDRRVREADCYLKLSARVKNFQQSCPLVVNLRHPSMRERHWEELMKATGVHIDIHSPAFNLGDLLNLNLPQYESVVETIVDRALKEEKMEKSLAKLAESWASVSFSFMQAAPAAGSSSSSSSSSTIKLVKVTEEDVEQLENDQLVVQSMMGSKYMPTFEKDISSWKKGLGSVEKVSSIWAEIQRAWAYLVSLFIGSEEVKRDLPEDSKRFATVDTEVRAFLKQVEQDPNVYRTCTREGLFEHLQDLQRRLEMCEKSLFEYLDSKRMAFPRFYFVSTTDLLDILCNGNVPSKIMVHMPKIFQAVQNLDLDSSVAPPVASSMNSAVGTEVVPFVKPLALAGKVESYLGLTIRAMMDAMRHELHTAITRYHAPGAVREKWVTDVPNQCVLVATQAAWTSEIESALARGGEAGAAEGLRSYRERQKKQIDALIDMVTGDLTPALRQKVMVLITLDTHARDVTDTLIREKVSSVTHFRWQSQLRYRWDEQEADMFISITDARFRYGHEYLGNGPRLVITPLTDRIYITASQSLHLKLGCAPAGPAGTGKTETTKDLASQLGKACYVFNCSDQMDYKGMGNIFKGLAASGCWGCFDEFNRLVPEVLSVCSQQFKAVLDAIRSHAPTFTVEGATLPLDPTCGVFITMNPGYLGRTELPETLKTLFRPITVVVPDLELICENMLMAEGFKMAKELARRFVTLYSLLRDLLSKQDHYDWGLRAIKSVLLVAGTFKRAEPQVPEPDLLMRALRDSNLAKIPDDDVPVFLGLIGDLFPGINIPRRSVASLEAALKGVCQDPKKWPELEGRRVTPEEGFLLKAVQLDELLIIRHCVFIIGSSGTGKSTVWKALSKAWTAMGRPTTIRDLNPKSITSNELYGYVELASREWKDGLLSNIMREVANVPDKDPKWIILDGDLDANWIESMNSVMDDNRILTLASNERIPLLPHCRMIFEIRDLRYATPATVSRAGIIYLSEANQWLSYATSWIAARTDDPAPQKKALKELFDRYVPDTMRHVAKTYKAIVPVLPFSLVQALCHILEGLLDPHALGLEPEASLPAPVLETYFVFAAVWAFGSALAVKDNIDHRQGFSDWWKETWKAVKFPARGSVFDVFVDPGTHRFVQWRSVVEEITFDSRLSRMRDVTVPIAETTSIEYFMHALMDRGRPVMLVGNAGCGKTALVRGILQYLPDDHTHVSISLNYYSDSRSLQRSMEEPLEKKAGRTFGPPGNKKLVYFVDDLNMPMLDAYNTQTPIALMRQHLDYGHWFDRDRLSYRDLKKIEGVQFITAMNPGAGSFVVNPRLQRHFVTFAMDLPSPGSLMDIYRTFIAGHLATGFDEAVQGLATKLVHATLHLHGRVAETFRKTAANFHYEFNMRHIANVFEGLLMARPSGPAFQGEGADAKFVTLWLHECERVYCDRLVSRADITAYRKLAREANSKQFANYNLGHLLDDKGKALNVFCHFARGLQDASYDRAGNLDRLRAILEEALNEYNEVNAQMNLLLFEDAVRHVARIARIIMSPGGHALLVGVGGSGKQSLARLAAFTVGYSVQQITISSTYGLSDLAEDLRAMFVRAGEKDEGLLFLLTEAQITNERFLVFINDLLSSGDVPELFTQDDRDAIVNNIRLAVKTAGIEDTRDNCWRFFLDRVRTNLHVALCFSPLNASFRVRLRRFPALVTCTIIDWFHPWPKDALLGVAKRFLEDVDLGSDEIRAGVENFMPFAYEMVNKVAEDYLAVERRQYHTTPKSYLELISLFKSMLTKKRKQLTETVERLTSGIEKLEATGRDVAVLQERLKEQSVEVEEKKLAAEVFAEQVGKEKAVVEAESAKANAEAEECQIIAQQVSVKRATCERELAAAEPAVARAEAALNTLNKKELTEMKSLTRPPAGVDDVLAAVLVLTSSAKTGVPKVDKRTWNQSILLMSKVDTFITLLKGFKSEIDAQTVPARNFKEVRMYLEMKHFNKDAMYVKSHAAAGLTEWVINIVEYYDIVERVEPMRQALAEAEQQLQEANQRMSDSKARVAELQERLDALLKQYAEAEAAKQGMVEAVAKSQARLDLAQRLVSALESENVRWRQGVQSLGQDMQVIVGDVLLSSSFVSYIGGFSKRYRDALLHEHWVPFLTKNRVPLSESTDVLKILASDSLVAMWQNQGLPADRVSVENATIVANTERWPLIIDPQLQGIAWLREREASNGLVVVRLGQKGTARAFEEAIEQGHSLLVENIGESIDAMFGPIIARQVVRKHGVSYLKLGDKEIELHKNFRLFLHTKLSNPHYPPEIQAETTLINFAVTEAGLEDQMLAIVVRSERPELEEQKAILIKQQNDFKIKLSELESDLLLRLNSAQGDVTEDVELIENLEESKRLASEITEKVKIARETEVQINAAREAYRKVAARGALLFFLLRDLRKVNGLYEYSLNAFTAVFNRGIAKKKAKKSSSSSNGSKVNVLVTPAAEGAGEAASAEAGEGQDQRTAQAAPEEAALAAAALAAAAAEEAEDEDEGLTDAERAARLTARIAELVDSITFQTFAYTRRGLFDKHKLIFATQLCLAIQEKEGKVDRDELDYLLNAREVLGTRPERERVSQFINEPTWARVAGLCRLPSFAKFGDEINKLVDAWEKWTGHESPESQPLPRDLKGPVRTAFQRLLVIRALRPDRTVSAVRDFVLEALGERFVEQPPFDLAGAVGESSRANPIMFILFPGAQPVKDVEALAKERGVSFATVSMGQGQEPIAEGLLDRFSDPAGQGGWVFLDNVHLMSSWLPKLERKLETIAEAGHQDFRCFFSAEPSSDPSRSSVPEGILQVSIKIANEPPSDLKANLRRAFAQFTPETLAGSSKPELFKPTLYALCFFHAVVLGRRRFGTAGWSRHYSFNQGDLAISAQVLHNYLESSASGKVPFEDINYMFGEILYGGHITDHWDRRTCNTYLEVLLRTELFQGMALAPGFASPAPLEYDGYRRHIEESLPKESPVMFGLHPNAEVLLLTASATAMFTTLLDMRGAAATEGGAGGGVKSEGALSRIIDELLPLFAPLPAVQLPPERGPLLVVMAQELARMASLLAEIRRSLDELSLGIKGQLNVSEAMEALANSLLLDRVPATWAAVAYPSLKGLGSWVKDLQRRMEQLKTWSATTTPNSVWISGLFNPQAFMTAVMQVHARSHSTSLGELAITTSVTRFLPSEITRPAEEGWYVHGFYLEGCRWDLENGHLADARIKELENSLPVVQLIPTLSSAVPSGEKVYTCPVYVTSQRGPTYVCSAQLATEDKPSKWVLAGAALTLQTDF